MSNTQFPEALFSEILPGLWQGGTDDLDVAGGPAHYRIRKEQFQSVFTLYGNANGVNWGVKEQRLGFYDGDLTDIDPIEDLGPMVRAAYKDWKSGKQVLIRCQAGLNRSGLVMALVLLLDGHTPEQAIRLIRRQRGPAALCNYTFETFILNQAASSFWSPSLAA